MTGYYLLYVLRCFHFSARTYILDITLSFYSVNKFRKFVSRCCKSSQLRGSNDVILTADDIVPLNDEPLLVESSASDRHRRNAEPDTLSVLEAASLSNSDRPIRTLVSTRNFHFITAHLRSFLFVLLLICSRGGNNKLCSFALTAPPSFYWIVYAIKAMLLNSSVVLITSLSHARPS